MKVKAVYDYGDSVIDRYTIVTDELTEGYPGDPKRYMALGVSRDTTPGGFSQWDAVNAEEEALSGQAITFDDLPQNVQEHVHERLG